MRNIVAVPLWALLACVVFVSTVEAQEADSVDVDLENLTLVYEREVYTYNGENRRDPFQPLTDENEMGPRFESLSLQGIIYSAESGRSVALLADGDGRIHRVRVGNTVGNSRVIEIGPVRVVLAVENFGTTRQEILELPSRRGN